MKPVGIVFRTANVNLGYLKLETHFG